MHLTEKQTIFHKNPVELAFVGDAVFEMMVRTRIAKTVDVSAHKLHRMAVEYVCADAQSAALEHILPLLSEEELDLVRRGKNASKISVPRNGTPRTYRSATGFEALFGYLHLVGEHDRVAELFEAVCAFHDAAKTE